jgi:hypothetical protein
MATVWMRHPDLPEQPIEVQDKAVPHYQSSGWSVTDAPEKPARKRPTPAGSTGEEVPAPVVEEKTEEPAPEKPARRRAPKESDEK